MTLDKHGEVVLSGACRKVDNSSHNDGPLKVSGAALLDLGSQHAKRPYVVTARLL